MKCIMKNIMYRVLGLSALCLGVFVFSCSDISETQEQFLSQGEKSYVGKLDSVEVYGGINRVVISGENTYLRNATKCHVEWTSVLGEKGEQIFDIAEHIEGRFTKVEIANLAEGNYDFIVYTTDNIGNKSLSVACSGSVYGEEYAANQLKMVATSIAKNSDGSADIHLSEVDDVVSIRVDYYNSSDELVSMEFDSPSGNVVIPDWRGAQSESISITTSIIPESKHGIDVLELGKQTQNIERGMAKYSADKGQFSVQQYTAHDDTGHELPPHGGGGGTIALIDGNENSEMWSNGVPNVFSFDMGQAHYLTEVSVVGRKDYVGWDLVKFEIWGRESLDDGPDGDTGYYIQTDGGVTSLIADFEAEALRRGWKRVGKGWFTYGEKGYRPTPQRATTQLTEVDHSFRPRYIMFRMMSVMTPDDFGNHYNYNGDDGGYWLYDGFMKEDRRTANVGELYFNAQDYMYNIQ